MTELQHPLPQPLLHLVRRAPFRTRRHAAMNAISSRYDESVS
ncbi:MAG: hypothetical protein P8Y27_21020 [Chromatiaceae bacterium]